ncbi:hypothetical protein BpHYR1_025693 [Brachionus plicatilis]|uniref:Uncharacterized protein n=1 Tax=Brachionus plicatilis TaxID=10195 RepID=A0A3M7SHL3_BRAPC|nr:hypothetical protein BpHYR1_025693 [Brachionus plicatilis]
MIEELMIKKLKFRNFVVGDHLIFNQILGFFKIFQSILTIDEESIHRKIDFKKNDKIRQNS